ncbi:uncharacterized protein LOC131638947 [Vicia villosa]|uniref:uncharacterized protein LOC131638947 n=1 Tax=Vicia villosa TaxID=3911 RepID=UPI00273B49A7|nr:uncharacterized protein LOC131638947 [Vicia villosa]
MSQQSNPQPPSKMFASSTHVQDTKDVPINPNVILEVTPLQMVTPDDLVAKKPRTSHARRTKETTRRPKRPNFDQTSQSSVPPSREELSKQCYSGNVVDSIQANDDMDTTVHEENVVDNDVNDAVNINDVVNMYVSMDENNKNDDVVETIGKEDVIADDDHTVVPVDVLNDEDVPSNASAEKDEGHTESGQTKEREPEKIHVNKVINLDDLSDDDLVASINSSIAKRLMRRKGKQAVDEDSLKKKVKVKPTSVGPKKSRSKVVPKKRRLESLLRMSQILMLLWMSMTSIPRRRWKFIYQKRLALERELTTNALECEEIVNIIHEAGLIKTVTQFSKCYEVFVKEFIMNLHEDCGNKKA